MNLRAAARFLPAWKNVLLALLASVQLILAFPPFELWFTAWFALVPLLWAIEREGSTCRSFILDWLFGNIFFFGTCWWLTFAPITYAGFPAPLAYLLLFCVTSVAAIFPGLSAALSALLFKRFGPKAFLAVPFVWTFTEFARYWITGNNWNAIAYSHAFSNSAEPKFFSLIGLVLITMAELGGIYFTGFIIMVLNAAFGYVLVYRTVKACLTTFVVIVIVGIWSVLFMMARYPAESVRYQDSTLNYVIAIQPNVPMAGLTEAKWNEHRKRHVALAESALAGIRYPDGFHGLSRTVIFPESPMNFMYEDDPGTKEFINSFAVKNDVSVLFNSAEPDPSNGKYFNSAVKVGPDGKEAAQYDKIYLLPFGEAVPFPLEAVMPAFVGSFSYGKEYDLLPLGDAKAGVMICFESHFGQLSREYVQNGADAIIEMTNDGYLGPTPVLRQHLANAVFRAVETNRPVLRVTNVGITAYINERGEVLDAAPVYAEDTRVWSVALSDGSQTLYVKYGDWFAWLCSIVTIGLILFGFARKSEPPAVAGG